LFTFSYFYKLTGLVNTAQLFRESLAGS
jgi:hypothetical protein